MRLSNPKVSFPQPFSVSPKGVSSLSVVKNYGVQRNQISGETDWIEMAYAIGEGTHTVEWRYEKDVSVSSGSDCGWVDDVVWTPEGA